MDVNKLYFICKFRNPKPTTKQALDCAGSPAATGRRQTSIPSSSCPRYLSSRLSSTSLSFSQGSHEFPQCREAFVSLRDLPMVALFDVDDVVAVILHDLRCEHQGSSYPTLSLQQLIEVLSCRD